MDHREVSDFSYVSLYDAFYRANGVKVRNLTISTGQKRPFNIRFSNISNQNIEEGKYPGAFVFPPEKGLKVTKLSIEERIRKAELTKNTDHPVYQEWLNVDKDTIGLYYDYIEQNGPKIQSGINNDLYSDKHFREFLEEKIGRPITGLDFSSLYPSIIRTYNLSPEYCIPDTKEGRKLAREIKNSGQKITIVKFEFNGREIKGYFIWHNNKINITDEGFQFGVFPYILNDLFNRRAIIKKQMKEYDHKKEEMEKIEENKPGYLLEYKDQYEDIIFNKTYLNSKQNALKVFMNTFYGEAGNKISPFFLLEVAGGVTSLGQRNIKFAYNQVTEKGCHVYYGDTDSIYLSVPEKTFYEVDKLFYTNKISKLEYWTQLVELTFKIIKPINKEVNDAFLIDNGTAFLTMAYEEVLFPVAFTAKKKYYGIPHENIVNFKPKDLFIRGLDVKKRGVSELLRKVFTEIMWSSMTHDNLYDLMELVFQKIDMIYNTKWSLSDFTKSDVFRPKKANVKIQTFVKRMAEQNIYVKPGERFSYVIAKKYPYSYDFRGRKVELKIGDKMELLSVAEENKLEIDLDYYMQSSIKGQFARLITYHDSFQVKPIDQTDAELKIAEYKTYDNACKFIDNYCKKYYSKYNTFGKVNQKIFREANSLVGARIKQSDKLCYTLLSANVDLETFGDWLNEYTDKKAEKMTEDYGEYIIKEMLKGLSKEDKIKKISILQKVYYGNGPKSLSINRKLAFDKEQLSLNSKLHHLMNDIHKLYNIYHKSVGQIIQIMKKNITIDQSLFEPTDKEKDYKVDDLDLEYDLDLVKINADKCSNDIIKNEEFIELLNKLKSLYLEYLSNKVYYKRTESMVVYLKKLRDKRFGIINIPIDIKNIINNDVKNMSECDIVIKQ